MTHLESELNDAVKSINSQQSSLQVQQGSRPLNLKVIGVGLVIFAAWAYTGFMGPSAFLSVFQVHSECVRFAKEKEIFKVYGNRQQGYASRIMDNVEAKNLRIRHSAWVVDLFAYDVAGKDLQHRTCVVDGQTIQITSMLQDWMFK
jgi:hypothetical protein